jgi:DNA-binding NarL/FixJ family response regulator
MVEGVPFVLTKRLPSVRVSGKAGPRRSDPRDPFHKNQTILIASPSPDVRRRWRRGLVSRIRVQEVGTSADLQASIARHPPDVLIVDVALLPIDGIGAVRRWSAMTKVLLLGRALEEPEALSVLKAGARGYCQRDSEPSLVRKALTMLQRGEVWVGSRVATSFLDAPGFAERPRCPAVGANGFLGDLTSREREVACLVGGGARNKEIASRLHITEATVKAHLSAVFRKLALSDRLHLGLLLAGQERDSSRPSGAL